MIAAQDETYRDAKNIHSKYMRHQAFESEIAANKDRLHKLIEVILVTWLSCQLTTQGQSEVDIYYGIC